MDTNIKEASLDVSSVIPNSKESVASAALSISDVVSAKAGTSQRAASVSSSTRKNIIRKIIPLDPKKLQQAGLDRKIAEALSKQKSQQNINQPNQNVKALPSHFPDIQATASKNVSVPKPTSTKPLPAKSIDNKALKQNEMKAPIITITGPETVTEQEKQTLANLNSELRLVHVKNLLNKKLLEKKRKEMNAKTNQLLKTPQATDDGMPQKQHKNVATENTLRKQLYTRLKEPVPDPTPPQPKLPVKPAETKTPVKLPQDIARKLVFKTNTPTEKSLGGTSSCNATPKPSATEIIPRTLHHPDDAEFFDCLNKGVVDMIPKASITSVNIQQQYKQAKQCTRKSKQVDNKIPIKHSFPMTNKEQNFQAVYMKQQRFVMQPETSATQTKPKTHKIDFPEVSPLKEPFPTANVPQETPLPAIDSFKKPYALPSSVYYNIPQKPSHPTEYTVGNYDNSLSNQPPTLSRANINSDKVAAPSNCLVVLENKILSQDEMIDLTELRLSSTTPRFINPHIPIPEVMIKQERPDDYQSPDATNSLAQSMPGQSNQKLPIAATTSISNKQKKLIINAQKLKLPPEQLADLARRIKQQATTNKSKTKEIKNVVNVCRDSAVLDPKVSNRVSPIQNSKFPLSQTSNDSTQQFVIGQTYDSNPESIVLNYNQDHDYYHERTSHTNTQTNTVNTVGMSPIESNVALSSAGPRSYSYHEVTQDSADQFDMTRNSLGFQDFTKSAVEIVDEPIETEDSFSAVDFIAALGNASAELSPEEQNLNASCTFNQTFSPAKINAASSPQTMPPAIQTTNAEENSLKRTIVIESSKGQETILTNESPEKIDLEKFKEKIRIYREINKQKLSNKSTELEQEDARTDSCYGPKLYDHTDACSMAIMAATHDQRSCVLAESAPITRRRQSGPKVSLITIEQPENALKPRVKSSRARKTSNNNKPDPTTTERRRKSMAKMSHITVENPGTDLEPSFVTISDNITNVSLEAPTIPTKLEIVAKAPHITTEKSQTGFEPSTAFLSTSETRANDHLETARPHSRRESVSQAAHITTEKSLIVSETSPKPSTAFASTSDKKANEVAKATHTTIEKPATLLEASSSKTSTVFVSASDKKTNDGLEAATIEKSETVLEAQSKPSRAFDLTTCEGVNDRDVCDEQTRNQQLDSQTQTGTTVPTTAAGQMLEIEPPQTSKYEIAEKISIITKPLPETEAAKNNETISNTTVASKRISKFKKGKINLVPRNKPSTVDKKSPTNNKDEQTMQRNQSLTPLDSKVGSDKKPETETAESTEMKSGACQNKILDVSQSIAEISKSSKHSDQQKANAVAEEAQTMETFRNATVQTPQNVPVVLEPETCGRTAQRDSFKDKIDAASTSAKSFNDLVSETRNTQVCREPEAVQNAETAATKANKAAEKITSTEKTVPENVIAESSLKKLPSPEIAPQSTTGNVASGEIDKAVKKSEQSQNISAEPTELQDNVDHNPASVNYNKTETKRIKQPNLEAEKSMSQPSLPNTMKGCAEKHQEFETEVTGGEGLAVAKIEEEQQNAFGLPKAKAKRMQVLQEPEKTGKVSEHATAMAMATDKVKENNAEKCAKSLQTPSSGLKAPNSQSEDEVDDTKTLEPGIGLPKTPSKKVSKAKQRYRTKSSDENPLITCQIEETKVTQNLDQQIPKVEDLNENSGKMLQTMKSARISLIDIVKHSSPAVQNEKLSILPFKKLHSDTKRNVADVSGALALCRQLKKGNGKDSEPEEKLQGTKQPGRETKKSLAKKEEPRTSTCCRRSSSRSSEALIPPAPTPAAPSPSPKITRRTHSLRQLVSDDDLEFLPENAALRFNIAQSKQEQENKKSSTPETRRKSLYASTPTKRNRYYSNTLETDATITFDNLKTGASPSKNSQSLATEESCHDTTQDSSSATPIKQRKKLRKTMEDIKKSQKAVSDTDSEDFQCDYEESLARDCEENSEFLGFDDTLAANASSFDSLRHASDAEPESRTKHGGLKNWLTTGKAIAPTLDSAASRKRLRHSDASPVASTSHTSAVVTEIAKQQIRVKKRWNLCSNSAYQETDITDDTSPAHDEEEISEQIPLKRKLKGGIKNVIDSSNKNAVDSKNLKLNEHSFKPPAVMEYCEAADTQPATAKAAESQQLKKSHLVDHGTKISASQSENVANNSPKANEERSKHQNISEKQTKNQNNKKTVVSKATPISKPCRAKHSGCQKPKVEHSSRNELPKKQIAQAEATCSTPQNLSSSKRKRGKTKGTPGELNASSDDETCLLSYKKRNLEISNILPTTANPKAVQPDDNSLLIALDSTVTADTSMSDAKPKAKRGRQRNLKNEPDFNPRLLLITTRTQLDSDEILTETSPGSGSIQCGLCLARTQPSQWISHLAQHYGVGWQVGQAELNIEFRSIVLHIITNYMKNSKCAGLACRMCQKVLRSALGIITHVEQCGNQERVECEFCKRSYTKTSLVSHLRICRVRYASDAQTKEHEMQSENTINVDEKIVGNSGRLKRHSTIKAESKLKVLRKELESLADNETSQIDPKLYVKYVPPQELKVTEIRSKENQNVIGFSCPKARCSFSSADLNLTMEHLKNCDHSKSGYICNFCLKAFEIEKEAFDHIIANHQKSRTRGKTDDSDCDVRTDLESSSDEDELSEGVDENESTGIASAEDDDVVEAESSKKSKNRYELFTHANVERKKIFDARSNDLDNKVLRKWSNFIKYNYSCEPLYNEFTPQYTVLNSPDYNKYLPTQTVSMKFNFSTDNKLIETVGLPEKNIKWSEIKRFESISNETHTYCFLGAPVKLCSWLPVPADVKEQFLAVVYRRDIFKYTKFSQPKKHHSIILLFKVTQNMKVPELSVHYGFVVNGGPIHHLSFLPSGGYDNATNRLGLVAVATVTSDIKIYSLPLNVDLAATSDSTINYDSMENIKLIELKPSFLLSLDASQSNNKDGEQEELLNCQCLQICWSEFLGHCHIFAGFSNGFIGVWNIKNNPEQNLNRFVIDDVINYTPLNYFYLGEKIIKCFALHYDTLGPRWLAVSTAYRKLIVFDIQNLTNPIIYKEDILKNVLLSMDWCPVWETFLITYDDVLSNTGNGVIIINPTNVVFQNCKMVTGTTGVSQAHYTPLTNMCVTALNSGEIVFLDTKEMHYDGCLSKRSFDRRAFCAVDIKKLDGGPLVRLPKRTKQSNNVEVPSDWIMIDHNYKDKYGLVFKPLLRLDEKLKKSYISEGRIPPQNVIPFMRINTLRCNINQQGKHLVAAGYENGFLRLINFNLAITR